MINYHKINILSSFEFEPQGAWYDGKGFEICTACLEFESGYISLVRVWDSRGFTHPLESLKYTFQGMEFPQIKKKSLNDNLGWCRREREREREKGGDGGRPISWLLTEGIGHKLHLHFSKTTGIFAWYRKIRLIRSDFKIQTDFSVFYSILMGPDFSTRFDKFC